MRYKGGKGVGVGDGRGGGGGGGVCVYSYFLSKLTFLAVFGHLWPNENFSQKSCHF